MLLTWGETLAEVRNYSELFIIFFLSKENVYTTVACVYMDYKRLMVSGKRRTGAEVNNYFTLIKAASCSGPQWFRNVCKFATDLQVRATKGSIFGARFRMNFRTKLIVPRTERSSLTVVGVFKSIMALFGSSSMRIPSTDKTCPRY